MKENARNWTVDESTLSEETKMKQKIFETLNKLTLDNYDDLKHDLIYYLQDD